MKNNLFTRALLLLLSLSLSVPLVGGNTPERVPEEGGMVAQPEKVHPEAQEAVDSEKYFYLLNLGLEAGGIASSHGFEHVIPVLGQQAAHELAHASLMRFCPFQSSLKRDVAGSVIDSIFSGISYWALLKRYEKVSKVKNKTSSLLYWTLRHSFAQFTKRMAVNFAYGGVIKGANAGLSSLGSEYRLGQYPQWITNSVLLSLVALEIPRLSKGFLGSMYDKLFYRKKEMESA